VLLSRAPASSDSFRCISAMPTPRAFFELEEPFPGTDRSLTPLVASLAPPNRFHRPTGRLSRRAVALAGATFQDLTRETRMRLRSFG